METESKGIKTSEALFIILAGCIMLSIIVGAVVLCALGKLTAKELMDALTGTPTIVIGAVAGLYAILRTAAKVMNGKAKLLLPFLLIPALGANSGCGLPWGKILSSAGVILTGIGQAGKIVVNVTCNEIKKYGSEKDYKHCLEVEALAKVATGSLDSNGSLLGDSGGPGTTPAPAKADKPGTMSLATLEKVKPEATINVIGVGEVKVTTMVPLSTAIEAKKTQPASAPASP